jgi:serine/threonine protein kinase
MAPEVKNAEEGEGYSAKNADVYSLGVCLHLMVTGMFPQSSPDSSQPSETAESGESNSSPNVGNSSQLKTQGLSEDLRRVLEEMLDEDEV